MPIRNPLISFLACMLLVAFPSTAGEVGPRDGSEPGLELYRDLPRDPLLVLGVWVEDPAEDLDGLLDFVTQFQGSAEVGAFELVAAVQHAAVQEVEHGGGLLAWLRLSLERFVEFHDQFVEPAAIVLQAVGLVDSAGHQSRLDQSEMV